MSAQATTRDVAPPALPLTLQIGFAGPRRLLEHLPAEPGASQQLRDELRAVLAGLAGTLNLGPQYFFTAVSQLAVGADTVFTELVAELGWPQRILLPQPRAEFLAAAGSAGPDFLPEQRAHAEQLLQSPHIVEERVVSTANTRAERFEETNLRILEEADVLLCVEVQGMAAGPGGTAHLLARARSRRQRVLVLKLRLAGESGPLLKLEQHGFDGAGLVISLPRCVQDTHEGIAIRDGELPSLQRYVQVVKMACSQRAGRRRVSFRIAAGVVVGSHVAATLAALLALKLGSSSQWVVAGLLAFEVALLLWGFLTHLRLHNEHALRDWAMARLCAETARSVACLRGMPMAFEHLRQLALPPEMNSLVKTLNVLHLRDNRACAEPATLEELRQRYLGERLKAQPPSGQQAYYGAEAGQAHGNYKLASTVFFLMSVLALLATSFKLIVLLWPVGIDWSMWTGVAGPAAILLPVVAVGFMSFATAMDWEARAHTFNDMHIFVQRQGDNLASAASLHELTGLALQTEGRLLGETLNWFARRAYVGVA